MDRWVIDYEQCSVQYSMHLVGKRLLKQLALVFPDMPIGSGVQSEDGLYAVIVCLRTSCDLIHGGWAAEAEKQRMLDVFRHCCDEVRVRVEASAGDLRWRRWWMEICDPVTGYPVRVGLLAI